MPLGLRANSASAFPRGLDTVVSSTAPDERAVFLNVPFDDSYEPLFIALIASLVAIGRIPRSVLEITESGQGRLRRILKQMEACRISMHDLSRVGQPARFNMPFELGLAYALRTYRHPPRRYLFLLLEKVPYRLSRTLSDLAGYDPVIHNGKPIGAITAVLDGLGKGRNDPSPQEVYRLWRKLMKVARALKRTERRDSIFSRAMFKRLVAAAAELATQAHLIQRYSEFVSRNLCQTCLTCLSP